MKKAVLLACSLLLLGLTACGGGEQSAVDDNWTLRQEKATEADAALPGENDTYTTLTTPCGEIKGVQYEGYSLYRGVRYATAGRWEQAQQVTQWDGVYDATAWGDQCPQHKGYFGVDDSAINQFYTEESLIQFPAGYSEDCLNLNIWVPDNAKDCPVLFYIHGGSFLTGSNTDPSVDGEAYAHEGIITVSINYRLGPLSCAFDGEDYLGNYSLSDQITAIHWIRDNIKCFGGDPDRITIMGESAGAASVQDLLVAPTLEDDAVSGAIMMSGGGALVGTPTTPELAKAMWDGVKAAFGVSSIDELKDVPAMDIYVAWCGVINDALAKPIVNGVELPTNVSMALLDNAVKDVPCIIGFLSEDMTPFTLYDAAMNYGKQRSEAGGQPVYVYYFDRALPGENQFGAFHAGDLWYAFGTLYRNWRPFDSTDYRIAEEMIAYISNFVKTGDPNGGDLAVWEPVTAENQRCLNFGNEPAAMCEPDANKLLETQNTCPAFPYVTAETETETTPISAEDLVGLWSITGYTVNADGSFVGVTEQTFEFNGTELYYTVAGDVASACYYNFDTEDQIALRNFDAAEDADPLIWPLSVNGDGQLLIVDPTYDITYVCERLS